MSNLSNSSNRPPHHFSGNSPHLSNLPEIENVIKNLETLFDELLSQQQKKILQIARTHLPHLTPDDLLNPHDFPELNHDPVFNYEEGLAAGVLATQMAVRARIIRPIQAELNRDIRGHDDY